MATNVRWKNASRSALAAAGAVALLTTGCSSGDDGAGAEPAGSTTVADVATTAAPSTTAPSTTTTTAAPRTPPVLAWSSQGADADLVVADDARVYLVAKSGTTRAIDVATGAVRWDVDRGASLGGAATTIAGDLVVQDIRDGRSTFVRLAGDTGAEVWRTTVATGVAATFVERRAPSVGIVATAKGGARVIDLANGALSPEVPGTLRAGSALRLATVDDDISTTVHFSDVPSMEPSGAPVVLGSSFGLDAVAMAGPDLIMVNGNELKLIDASGATLATGRTGVAPAVFVSALGGDRALVVGTGGSELFVRDGDRLEDVWRADGPAGPQLDGDRDYVVTVSAAGIQVLDASGAEPVVVASLDLGGGGVAGVAPRVSGGRVYATIAGHHVGYDLDPTGAGTGANVWSVPSAEGDVLHAAGGGVLRVTHAGRETVVELYR